MNCFVSKICTIIKNKLTNRGNLVSKNKLSDTEIGNNMNSIHISNNALVSSIDRFKGSFRDDTINIRYVTGYKVCNYSCEYCIAGQHNKIKHEQKFNFARYNSIINALVRLPFSINIRIGVEGEYFLSQELIDGGKILSNSENIKTVNLITNLSYDLEKYLYMLNGYNQQKIAIVASYHPTQISDKNRWMNTAISMNEKYDFAVVLVAYPPILKTIFDVVNKLKNHGIEVFVQGFIGKYDGKEYPHSYTAEEKAMLKRIMYSRHDFEFFINSKRPGLCNAGFKSIYVNEEGAVYSCGMGKGVKLGSLLESNEMYFFDGPRPCIHPSCLCDTENINTLIFEQHYQTNGKNQHKYTYRYKSISDKQHELDEWEIEY